jgi:hypothetical protein
MVVESCVGCATLGMALDMRVQDLKNPSKGALQVWLALGSCRIIKRITMDPCPVGGPWLCYATAQSRGILVACIRRN